MLPAEAAQIVVEDGQPEVAVEEDDSAVSVQQWTVRSALSKSQTTWGYAATAV